MEIKSLISKKRMLFAAGELPFDSLAAPENRSKLQKEFKLETLSWGERGNIPMLHGTRGQFPYQDKIRSIMEMSIQPIALEVIVDGETEGADCVLGILEALLSSFSAVERTDKWQPRETSHETFCVCHLETESWWQLSQPYTDFLHSAVLPKISEAYPNAEVVMLPGQVQFRLLFKMKVAHHLIAPKTFAIELREGVSAEERLFWTTSPLRSETHLEILRQFEEMAGSAPR